MAGGAQHTHIDIEVDARATFLLLQVAHVMRSVNAGRGMSVFRLQQHEATYRKGTRT
jgi:hypothetical protein